MQSHSTTGLRLLVSQFVLASRYRKLLHVCFLKDYFGGGGLNHFNRCIICLVSLFLNDDQKIKLLTNHMRKYYSIGDSSS